MRESYYSMSICKACLLRRGSVNITMVLILFAYAVLGGHARAQEELDCGVLPETITTFERYVRGDLTVWAVTDGGPFQEDAFIHGFAVEGNIYGVGYRRLAGDHKALLVSMLGQRGRVAWSKLHNVDGLISIREVLKVGDQYVVVGAVSPNEKQRKPWMGVLDGEGNLVRTKVISVAAPQAEITDVVVIPETNRLLMSMRLDDQKGQPEYSAVYDVSLQGQVVEKRLFNLGMGGVIETLIALDNDGGYLGVGSALGTKSERQGWVLRINKHYRLQWQLPITRGQYATFEHAALLPDVMSASGGPVLVMGGYALPVEKRGSKRNNEDLAAAWVLALDPDNASILWSRLYKSTDNNRVATIFPMKQGVISAVINTRSNEKNGAHFTRVVTLNARGQVIDGSEYFNEGAAITRSLMPYDDMFYMIVGQTERVYSEQEMQILQLRSPELFPAGPFEPKEKTSLDAWVAKVSLTDSYEDPCIAR